MVGGTGFQGTISDGMLRSRAGRKHQTDPRARGPWKEKWGKNALPVSVATSSRYSPEVLGLEWTEASREASLPLAHMARCYLRASVRKF